MEKRPVALLIDANILDALDRFAQSQGIPRDSLIAEACRHYLAQLSSPRSQLSGGSRPRLELELLESEGGRRGRAQPAHSPVRASRLRVSHQRP